MLHSGELQVGLYHIFSMVSMEPLGFAPNALQPNTRDSPRVFVMSDFKEVDEPYRLPKGASMLSRRLNCRCIC
jgi:hypothetical protein